MSERDAGRLEAQAHARRARERAKSVEYREVRVELKVRVPVSRGDNPDAVGYLTEVLADDGVFDFYLRDSGNDFAFRVTQAKVLRGDEKVYIVLWDGYSAEVESVWENEADAQAAAARLRISTGEAAPSPVLITAEVQRGERT